MGSISKINTSITISDVAKLAGVSKSTVSRELNGTGPVKKETKDKIYQAIKELNYSPSPIARSMRTGSSKTIAVFIPDFVNGFYWEVISGMEMVATQEGYIIVTCVTNEDAKYEYQYIQRLLSRQVDGIIFFTYKGVRSNIKYLKEISAMVPVIFMDPVATDASVSMVTTDGYQGTKNAVNYLIELGHQAIAYIKGPANYMATTVRYKGYKDALAEAGIRFNESLVYEADLSNLLKSGFDSIDYFLSLEKRPTAIMAIDDMIAIGALNGLKIKNINVPEDIAVIGYDDIPLSRIVSPSLTTIAQPIKQLGYEAIVLMLEKIKNPDYSNKKIVLDTRLIIRHSTDPSKPLVEQY